jgi:hypothetical protein
MRWRSRGPGRTRRPALPRHPVRRRSLAADLSPCGRAGRTGLAVAAIGGGSAATRAGVARNSRRPQLRRVAGCGRGACGASADHPESLRATRPAVNAEENDQSSPLPLLSAQPPKAASPSRAASPDFRLRAASERLRPGALDACSGRETEVATTRELAVASRVEAGARGVPLGWRRRPFRGAVAASAPR